MKTPKIEAQEQKEENYLEIKEATFQCLHPYLEMTALLEIYSDDFKI